MWGKLSDDFRMICLHCGYSWNPYCEAASLGHSLDQVFNAVKYRPCPECRKTEWKHNF